MATRETARDRAAAAAGQRKALAEGALPVGTTTTELGLAGNGKPVKGDPLRDLLDKFQPEIEKQFPIQLRINPAPWMRMVLTGMRTSKQAAQLAKCDRPSLFSALLESARFGLTPFTDEAAIVPYGRTATFIPMAQGFVRMFWNSGQIRGVVVDFIRDNEVRGRDWEVSRGSAGDGFWHKPRFIDDETLEPVKPGKPMLAYCYLKFADGTMSEPAIVTKWDAEEVMRTRSKAWQNAENTGKKDSLWHTDFPAMWLKTAVRRAAKYGPKSAELQELLLIEAREDRTRNDAPRAQAPTGEVEGVDWSTDIAGGKVVQSTVLREDEDGSPPFPGNAQPNGNDRRDDGGDWPDGARPPADVHLPAGDVTEVSQETTGDGTTDPAAAEAALARSKAEWAGKIGTRFAACGDAWKGKASIPARLVVAGVLAAADQEPPLQLASIAELDVTRSARVYTRLGKIRDAAREGDRDPGKDLQKLYDAVMDARTKETARRRAAAEAAERDNEDTDTGG